ncbi:hypothetical protein RBG61_03325 [Paludicola sp. MB14-C6]|uniref:hypothetical protein n=1 Tax=Paludihabitans sp. MB14-C6 TaxID=3070656 RepID=UPI0027DC26F9|nr:hypothetical protein [Paludicola sp. MB14-C6]WMJ23712.1 hypothetical protein RBG61_03325 [Paludicola sp. MB14-C6]
MQNRYVGDVGDFGKYALLRYIAQTGLRLGVNWYLAPDENHNADGKHITYLSKSNYKELDSELYDVLNEILKKGTRNVTSIENSNLIPDNTIFYNAILDVSNEADHIKRRTQRATWHQTALSCLYDSDVIFLDPDNGLEVQSVSLTGQKGNKYIGLDELKDYYKSGKSIIFYNHRERKPEEEYLNKFRALKKDAVYKNSTWMGLKFVRGTIRDYIFVLQPQHAEMIKLQLEKILNSSWSQHFFKLEV